MIKFWSSFSPNVNAAGSSKGLSVLAVGDPTAVIVVGVTVEPVVDESLQHKSLVLVTFASGSVDGLNDEL